jgi:hypothetical protein
MNFITTAIYAQKELTTSASIAIDEEKVAYTGSDLVMQHGQNGKV